MPNTSNMFNTANTYNACNQKKRQPKPAQKKKQYYFIIFRI